MGMRLTRDIAPRPERLQGVPYTRLRGDDLLNLCRFYAAWDTIEKLLCDESFVRRCKTLPGGYRDLCMLRSKMDRLAEDLMHTVPREKAIGAQTALERMRFSVSQAKIASHDKYDDEQIIKRKWLNTLIKEAHQNTCKLCVGRNCNQCRLGKVLDNMVEADRDGGSWAMLDIEVDE